MEKCISAENVLKVYWDYSNIYDPGNYDDTAGDANAFKTATVEEMADCYLQADYIIAYTPTLQTDKPFITLEKSDFGFLILESIFSM